MNDATEHGLRCEVRETGSNPDCAVIWLHGLGADGNDFVPIVPQLRRSARHSIRFLFPHAPVRPVTINGGMRMRAWYDILGVEIAHKQDRPGIQDSVRRVGGLIDETMRFGIPPERIVLGGFSQGGAIALRTGLAFGRRLAGIAALSCYLLDGEQLESWSAGHRDQVPVFMAHGTLDPVVPVGLGEQAARRLQQAGCQVSWRTWPMPHSVCAEEVEALDRWLSERLEPAT